jgi:hypothetical protein
LSTLDEAREKARNKLIAAILERAACDAQFRSRLLADPKRAIKDSFGISIPEHVRIRFIEKDADVDILVVLPNPIDPNAELGANDLEAVSGGQDQIEGGVDGFEDPW